MSTTDQQQDQYAPIASGPTPFPVSIGRPGELLHDLFAQGAAGRSAHVAVRVADPDPEVSRRTFLTYGDLDLRAERFRAYLAGLGVGVGDRVMICLPRELDQYWVVLGILRAGGAYVPVDWSVPQERADYILEDSGARAVVTCGPTRKAAFGARVVAIDVEAELGDIAAADDRIAGYRDAAVTPEDLAYIIYTSGTTGRPKGAMIRHRNACHFVRAESAVLGLNASDRVYGGFSLAFDMSVETVWTGWFAGAEVVCGSERLARSGPDVAETLARMEITAWHVVPSLLAHVEVDVPTARLINLGGEACPTELARRWSAPGRRLVNTYGPTETTVTATWAELSLDRPVTIGRPLPGCWAWIVDETLAPVPAGEAGELLIGGRGVGAGYVNLPELTAKAFIEPPFTGRHGGPEQVYRTGDLCRLDARGDINFLGRIDTQVKIRGFRVELGEIEAEITRDTAVAGAVVNVYPDDQGGDLMVAFVTPRGGDTIDAARLRASLRDRLPVYMQPQVYEVRRALPTLTSGKIDRKALLRPADVEAEGREVEPPSGPTETKLLAAWKTVFAPQRVSVLDNFFEDLGGHSLKAARMVSLSRADPFLARLSIQDLYQAPTIRDLARRIDATSQPESRARHPAFRPIPQSRRVFCVGAQTLSLVAIYAFAGAQWVLPYLAYIDVTTDEGWLAGLEAAAIVFAVVPPVMVAFSIVVKWCVIGRFKPGDYPLWGAYYFRWWFVRRFLAVIPVQFLAGSPLMNVYFRLLGARIGKDVFLGLEDIDSADLVSIGDGAVVSAGAMLATTAVERGLLRVGQVRIGRGAFLGDMAVVGRGGVVEDGGALEDLSALPEGGRIPAGESWSGSPAKPNGRAVLAEPPVAKPWLHRAAITVGLAATTMALPVIAVAPIAPGMIAMLEIGARAEGYGYLISTPLLAASYVLSMCLLNAAVKWLLLGRVKPGVYATRSLFYIRFWLVDRVGALALELLHPIFATLYVRPWYRLMGARVGARSEISTASAVAHDLVEIGEESFIADGAVFGAPRMGRGTIRLETSRIGRRTFIGNSALLPTGSDVPDEVLIGVLSKPPGDPAQAAETGATWFGSPALRLPTRQASALFDEGARFHPSRRLIAARLAIEYVRITLSQTAFIALFFVMLDAFGTILDRVHGLVWLAVSFPFIYIAFNLVLGVFVLGLKWAVIGRYRPRVAPLWSFFVWRSELVTSTYETLASSLLLDPLRGTPYINIFLRLMGCRIGKRVFTDTTDITEFDLVRVGDDAALNSDAGLQTHLFEDRVMKVGRIDVGARAAVGSVSIVLYDSVIEDEAQLGDLSVLMKGERLPAGTAWEGSPAQAVR